MTVLAGDIGGTSTRLALVDDDPRAPVAFAVYPSRDHDGLEAMIDAFLAEHPADVAAACFGVAGPVRDGVEVETTNLAWPVHGPPLAARLGLSRVRLLNDLEANAYGLPALRGADLATLQDGEPDPAGPLAVVSAGTGLGMAIARRAGDALEVLPSEGGHADFAPRSELEVDVWRGLAARFGHVSAERVCSGSGLPNVYAVLRERSGVPEPAWLTEDLARDPGAAITLAALEERDPVCGQTLDVFVSAYGATAGNVALTVLATGGVYLGGGIAPRILRRLREDFVPAFRAKGRFEGLLERIPVHVILEDRTALFGAARYALADAVLAPPARPTSTS